MYLFSDNFSLDIWTTAVWMAVQIFFTESTQHAKVQEGGCSKPSRNTTVAHFDSKRNTIEGSSSWRWRDQEDKRETVQWMHKKWKRPYDEINLPTAFLFNEHGADLFSVWLCRFVWCRTEQALFIATLGDQVWDRRTETVKSKLSAVEIDLTSDFVGYFFLL